MCANVASGSLAKRRRRHGRSSTHSRHANNRKRDQDSGQQGSDARRAIHPKALSAQAVCVPTAPADSSERAPATATAHYSTKNLRILVNCRSEDAWGSTSSMCECVMANVDPESACCWHVRVRSGARPQRIGEAIKVTGPVDPSVAEQDGLLVTRRC